MREIGEVVTHLQSIAPLGLAADWDNVGLLIEGERPVQRMVLCVDLTEHVLAEVIARGADLVVAYHPPIFKGLTRLADSPSGRIVLRAVRAGLHVYSPHSALDAAEDGMTDWLVRAVGDVYGIAPVIPVPDQPRAGLGRTATLRMPLPIGEIVPRVKAHLGISSVRVAAPDDLGLIHTVATCPGAGGDVAMRARHADLILTGEMRHHDVLAALARGIAVLLTEHTNSERGFLAILAQRLRNAMPDLEISCSAVDREPLTTR